MSIVFGPVPSRRLGRSLGINNIPYKICTYACVYCQIGRTLKMDVRRKKFYEPEEIYREVEKKIKYMEEKGEDVDYITFVPDGEPTLDINLGKEAQVLRNLGYPLAILTNASLLWMKDVREELLNFDFVSLKVDAVDRALWRRIDRPHKSLKIEKILEGNLEFRDNFDGKLVTETMLIDGIDYGDEIGKIADYLRELNPDVAYIAIPTRPPTEKWAKPPEESLIAKAYHIFSQKLKRVEYLIGYEGNEFAATGNFEEDILSITAVHPMREDAVKELLRKDNASYELLENLIKEGRLKIAEFGGKRYYIRRFNSK